MQVTAKSNIKHDGQVFEKGQTLDVSEEQAAKLLAAGVIEKVKGLEPEAPEEAPDKSLGTPNDKQDENKGIAEVANLPVNDKMKKEKLRGIALAMGLTVEKTMTGKEIYAMIVEARGGEAGEETTEDSKEDDKQPGEESNENAEGSEDAEKSEDETPAK